MPEYIGPISIPDQTPVGTFPLTPDFGAVKTYAPEIVTQRFGHGDASAEQRFFGGDGLIRWTLPFARLSPLRMATLQQFFEEHFQESIPFNLRLPMPDGSIHAVVARFDGALSLQALSGGAYFTASVKLCEVPQTTPSYTPTRTVTRFPDTTTLTALLSDTQELIPLVTIIPAGTSTSNRIALLLDMSGSIDAPTFDLEKSAAIALVAALGSAWQICVYSFGNASVTLVIDYGADRSAITPAINALSFCWNDTPLYRAIETASVAGPAHIVIFSDGANQDILHGEITITDAINAAVSASASIHSLGFGDADADVLAQLASATGGSSTIAPSASDLAELATELGSAISLAPAFLSNRRVIIGGQLYQPRILSISEITQSIDGAADQFSATFGNADRVFSQLARAVTLYGATLEFSYFHVNSGTLLNLWSGEINDFQDDATDKFTITAGDPVWNLRKNYPVLTIDRNDPQFQVPDQPVQVHSGGNRLTSTSIASDTVYGQPIQDVWINDDQHPLKVPCQIISGRDESQYYTALGIVSRGPIGGFYQLTDKEHTLDGQPWHGVGDSDPSKRMYGLRRSYGGNPSTGNPASTDNSPDAGSNFFALDDTSLSWPRNTQPVDGVAFMQIRRTDASGIQPVAVNTHDMEAYISEGLGGWVWTAPGTRAWRRGLTNMIWVAVNTFLVWKSAQFASSASDSLSVNLQKLDWYRSATAAQMEAWFDCPKAIADGAICDISVTPLFARTHQVWVQDPVETPPSFPPPSGWTTGGGHYETQDITSEPQWACAGVVGADSSGNPRPIRDVLRDIFGSGLGFFNFCGGKLRTGLAYNASATDAFTIGNTLYNSYSESSRRPSFTRLEVTYSDVDYDYGDNTMAYEDKDVLAIAGRSVKKARAWGVVTKSQAARITATKAREEVGGHGTTALMNARTHELRSTVLALSMEPGAVCSYTGPKTGGTTVKFRCNQWTLNPADYSLTIQGPTVTDEMYDLTAGPKPADVAPGAIPGRNLAGLRPLPVLPIIQDGVSYPFLVTGTMDGTSMFLSGEYCPPLPVRNFIGVTVYVEIPTGSGRLVCAGDFDYTGTRTAIDDQVWGVFCARLPLPATTTESWTVYLCSRTSALRAPLDTTAPHMAVTSGAIGVFAEPITSFAVTEVEIDGTLEEGGGRFTPNPDGSLTRIGDSSRGIAGTQSSRITFEVGIPNDPVTIGIYIVHAFFPDATYGTPYPATGGGWFGDGFGDIINTQDITRGSVETRQTQWTPLADRVLYQEFTARTYNSSTPPVTTAPPAGMIQKVTIAAAYRDSQLFLVNGN